MHQIISPLHLCVVCERGPVYGGPVAVERVPLVDIRPGRHQQLHHRHLLLQHGVDQGRLADLEGGHGILRSLH